jgi:hypothetical protein
MGDIVVRGHEGTHNIPYGDLNRACETGGAEIQTVSLTGWDTNGETFRLGFNGGISGLITRGTNFTTAGIAQAIQGRNEIQQAVLTGFNGTTASYQVQINGNNSQTLGLGGLAISNANVQAAINAIPGWAGTVTVSNAGNGGFTATFVGPSAATNAPDISIVNLSCAPTCTSVVNTTQTHIGAMPGWPAGGATIAVGALSDTGFTLTFGGNQATIDQPNFSVTQATTGVSGTVVETRKGSPAVSWRGMTIHDISNPNNPEFVKAIAICGSTHTITKYYDDVTNTMYVFGTGGGTGTNQPQWGLTECADLPDSRGDVIEIPMDNPERARLLQHQYVPMGFDGSCHDSNVFEELHLIAVACSGGGGASLIDMSDVKNPKVLWTYTYPGLQTTHSAAFSWDGRYVYINGEPGGGSGAECAFDDDTIKPMIHIIDTKTGQLVGMWMLPRPQDRVGSENCTTHTINTVPIVGKHLIAYSGYQGGVSVIDVTNPRTAREIAFVDQVSPQTGASGSGCWTGYWYNDNLYCSELDWGAHIFTVTDEWWKRAMDFDELNPQTNTKLIRCNASVSNVPARAGQRKRITVRVNLFGPAHLQPGWGIKVRVTGPGIDRTLTTGENGTASTVVRASRRGRLQATVAPAVNLPFGCKAPAKNIRARVSR